MKIMINNMIPIIYDTVYDTTDYRENNVHEILHLFHTSPIGTCKFAITLYMSIKKLSCAVGIIAKLRHYLNPKSLLSVYYAFFYSHILYGILGWGSATS